MKKEYEALVQYIDGSKNDYVDPIKRIIIDNGVHQYEFTPENLERILIRVIDSNVPTDE